MISGLSATNYGCLRNVEVTFKRLHALIGPNDSGKSTLLRAVRTASQLVASRFTIQKGRWYPFDPGVGSEADAAAVGTVLTLAGQSAKYRIQWEDHGSGRYQGYEQLEVDGFDALNGERSLTGESRFYNEQTPDWLEDARRQLGDTYSLALTEEGLRRPSGFMPKGQTFLTEKGEGLPGLYFALRNDREEAFERIIRRTRELFPTVKTVRTQPRSTTELELEVELTDGTRVRAAQISAGLLYFLAFVALPEFFGTSTILVEEPENGLHPARIREVMDVFRQISQTGKTQIIMATHSPLVVNELEPEEVSVVTRPSLDTGTRVTPITATPNFDKRSGVYALGELWLSYADGRAEEPLFNPEGR